jgi:hypothetical protein
LSRNEVAGFNCRESASEERLHSWMLRRFPVPTLSIGSRLLIHNSFW